MSESKTPRTDDESTLAAMVRELDAKLTDALAAKERAENDWHNAKSEAAEHREALQKALSNRAFDVGPWYAALGDTQPERAYIGSDDFTHDVRLYVNGDFTDLQQRLAYAREVAQRLNERDALAAKLAESEAAERSLSEQVKAMDAALAAAEGSLRDIGDWAHGRSAGPAIPDDMWEVRRMAYEGIDAARGVKS